MARASSGATLKVINGHSGGSSAYLTDFMTDDEIINQPAAKRLPDPLPPYAIQVQKGHRAYLRDLPALLKARREGYMVAYRGDDQVELCASDRKLYERLGKRPNYHAIKDELFVTRVTVLDAEQHGLSI